MYSVQVASDCKSGAFTNEQLEDDFITSLFSQDKPGPETSILQSNNGNQSSVSQNTSAWLSAVQMDHGYAASMEPSTLLSPAWEEPASTSSGPSRLNMSTYFSTFDPSAQFTTKDLLPMTQTKLCNAQQAMGKNHQARINLVPTKSGNFKAIVKRKRKRTVFRTDQVEAMEEVFVKKPYVTKEDRQALVEKLNISDKSIKVWFQNRRLKIKRGEEQSNSEDENRDSIDNDRLDYVESKIHEKTNEFGYVTLDDKIMNDLVNVIDEYLHSPRVNVTNEDITMGEPNSFSRIPVYEPISPASTIDNSTENISWECTSSVDNEYLQTLIDIESIITK